MRCNMHFGVDFSLLFVNVEFIWMKDILMYNGEKEMVIKSKSLNKAFILYR